MSTATLGPTPAPCPLALVILDGFGEHPETADNAVRLAHTPVLHALFAKHPHGLLHASGPYVGLPPGQMGNSEVGHLHLGAGRIHLMELPRINRAIEENLLATNPTLVALLDRLAGTGGRLHLLGLLSDGGVHSALTHFFALLDCAAARQIPTVVHAFLDGRDTPPCSALPFLAELEKRLPPGSCLGSVSGRYYAMDRDQRWDRTQQAFRAIVSGKGGRFETARAGVEATYAAGITDEFVPPFAVGGYAGVAPHQVDSMLHVNFRPDRARQLTRALTDPTFAHFPRVEPIFRYGACMTPYEADLELPSLFPQESLPETFPELLSRAGRTQFRCAETEKYAHVTYFFNGGREAPFPGEERRLIPSPQDVATYDLKPEMSAMAVAEAVVEAIHSQRFDFLLVNFANPDMVGHTGHLPAAIQAVEAVDAALGQIVGALTQYGGAMLLTADHGNCETMRDPETHLPHTAHTLNPVPVLYVNPHDLARRIRPDGSLRDVAPTLLALLGLAKPAAMTGESLLV